MLPIAQRKGDFLLPFSHLLWLSHDFRNTNSRRIKLKFIIAPFSLILNVNQFLFLLRNRNHLWILWIKLELLNFPWKSEWLKSSVAVLSNLSFEPFVSLEHLIIHILFTATIEKNVSFTMRIFICLIYQLHCSSWIESYIIVNY